MATVTYNFIPNEVVWYMTVDCGLKKSTVIRCDIAVITTETTIKYELKLEDNSRVKDVEEVSMYAEADIATAMTDYQAALLA